MRAETRIHRQGRSAAERVRSVTLERRTFSGSTLESGLRARCGGHFRLTWFDRTVSRRVDWRSGQLGRGRRRDGTNAAVELRTRQHRHLVDVLSGCALDSRPIRRSTTAGLVVRWRHDVFVEWSCRSLPDASGGSAPNTCFTRTTSTEWPTTCSQVALWRTSPLAIRRLQATSDSCESRWARRARRKCLRSCGQSSQSTVRLTGWTGARV